MSLSTGAQGQASPRGGGCLQARARLTESKAWEGDLPLKPGCGLSSAKKHQDSEGLYYLAGTYEPTTGMIFSTDGVPVLC